MNGVREVKEVEYYIFDPGGNKTALVINKMYDQGMKKYINDIILKKHTDVEQVGFLESNRCELQMAGGEFCGNATRCAVEYYLKPQNKGAILIKVSGMKEKLTSGIDEKGFVWVNIPVISVDELGNVKIVKMEGITHIVMSRTSQLETKQQMINYAKKLIRELKVNDKAVGVMFTVQSDDKVSLYPVVWVRDIDTFFFETACGSGTVAVTMCSGKDKISVLQPSGYEIVGEKYNVNGKTYVKIFGIVNSDSKIRKLNLEEENNMGKYEILKDLVKFNTVKDNENKEIIEYIEAYLKKIGFKTEHKSKNLIMSIGKDQKIGFLGHTDTVEYIQGWNTNPFELTKIGDKLYGLGTADMKGGIAAILDAVSKIEFDKLSYGMKLYFTYDEEIGFTGVYDINKMNEKFPELMIFGEPTYNEILFGSKGLMEYELYFNGKKAHSSNPEKGKSANLNAVKFISELTSFYEEKVKPFRENNYEIPYTTMNVGLINGGSAKNSIPAECYVAIDFRIANGEHIEIIRSKVNELAKKYDCTVKLIECVDPFFNEIPSIKAPVKTAGFITEASFVDNTKKIILGAGPVTAHEVNEYITEESYNKLVKQYIEIINNVCG